MKNNFENLGFYTLTNFDSIDLKVFNIKNKYLLMYVSNERIKSEKEARKELLDEIKKLYELYKVKRIKAYYVENDKLFAEFILKEDCFRDLKKNQITYFKKDLESFIKEVKE